jgi:hypothetical protein
MFCYDGGPIVIFPLSFYLDVCSSFFSFLLFGDCFLDFSIQVSGAGVYDGGNLPVCYIPLGRVSFSNCVLVFVPLVSACP